MFGHMVEVLGIFEHHRRVLTATFQRDLFQITISGIAQEPSPRFGRTSKSHHIYIHVPPQRLAHAWPITGKHLQHTAWDTRIGGKLRQT